MPVLIEQCEMGKAPPCLDFFGKYFRLLAVSYCRLKFVNEPTLFISIAPTASLHLAILKRTSRPNFMYGRILRR